MANPLFEQWFRLADEDRDGMVGGGEAVRFFQRSGLPTEVLGQIWDLSSAGRPSLNIMQFGIALRLVSLCQASGGRMDPNQGRAIIAGGGPPLPPPKLQGLDSGPGAGYMPQRTGLPSAGPGYAPQVTGLVQPGYTPNITGSNFGGPMPPRPYQQQLTGGAMPGGPMPGGPMPGGPRPGAPLMGPGGPMPGPGGPMPGYRPQISGGAFPPPSGPGTGPGPQMTGGGMMPQPAGFPQQKTGVQGFSPQTTGGPNPGYPSQPTGGLPQYSPQNTGLGSGLTIGLAGSSTFPPCSMDDFQRFNAMFAKLDANNDGLLEGAEVAGHFLPMGLDKFMLRDIWNLVALNASKLNRDQFNKFMYLVECSRKGIKIPTQLPPGPFPPTAANAGATGGSGGPGAQSVLAAAGLISSSTPAAAPSAVPTPAKPVWSLHSQFGDKGLTGAVNQAYAPVTTSIPNLPNRVVHEPPGKVTHKSGVPDMNDDVFASLAPIDKSKLESVKKEAVEAEKQLWEAEHTMHTSREANQAYTTALQELTLFKSRTTAALLQAQEQAGRLESEAQAIQRRYEAAYSSAEVQFSQSKSIRDHIQTLLQKKSDAEIKLKNLHEELRMISQMGPGDVERLEHEVAGLYDQMTEAESHKASHDMKMDQLAKQKEAMQARLRDLKLGQAAAEDELQAAQQDVSDLTSRVEGARATGDFGDVQRLLVKAARVYKSLYNTAQTTGLEIPFEAQLSNVDRMLWSDEILLEAEDWFASKDNSGYVVVNAFPDLDNLPAGISMAVRRRTSSMTGGANSGLPSPPMHAGLPPATGPVANGNAYAFQEVAAFAGLPPVGKPMKSNTPLPPGPPGPAPTSSFGDDAFGDNAFGAPPAAPVASIPAMSPGFPAPPMPNPPVSQPSQGPPSTATSGFGDDAFGDAGFADSAFGGPSPSPPPAASQNSANSTTLGFGASFEDDAFGPSSGSATSAFPPPPVPYAGATANKGFGAAAAPLPAPPPAAAPSGGGFGGFDDNAF